MISGDVKMKTDEKFSENNDKKSSESSWGIYLVVGIILCLLSLCSEGSKNGTDIDGLSACQVDCYNASKRSDYFDKKACLHRCDQWFRHR